MKSAEQVEREMIQIITQKNDSVTFYGKRGVLRGFITAVALKIRELWYDLQLISRELFVDTASRQGLIRIGAESGIQFAGSNPSGVLLILNGPENTVIAENTEVRTDTGIVFRTTYAVTLGQKNPGFVIDDEVRVSNPILNDFVWAECTISGSEGNVTANTVNNINISGVTVNNPSPAMGGADAESLDSFRARIKEQIKSLNMNTQRYYEVTCRQASENILRVRAVKDYSRPDAVKLIIVTKSGVPMDGPQLKYIEDFVTSNQRSFTNVKCENIAFTMVTIEMRAKLKSEGQGTNFNTYYIEMADRLSRYFDWSKWEFGKSISLDEVFTVAKGVSQTDDIELPSFKLNGSNKTNILIPANSLPYFQSLKITNITSPQSTVTKSNQSITQSYENYKIVETA